MDVIASTVGVVLIVLVVFLPLIVIALLVHTIRTNNARRRAEQSTLQAQQIAAAMQGLPIPEAAPVPWWKR